MGLIQNLTKRINIANLRKDLEALNNLVADSISNIMTLLGTKQNNLGFTPENTANKNLAGGYLGLDTNGQISNLILNNKNEFLTNVNFFHDFQRTFSASNFLNSSTTGVQALPDNLIYLDYPATNMRVYRPSLKASTIAGSGLIMANQGVSQLDSNWSFLFYSRVLLDNGGATTHYNYLIGIGDGTSNSYIPNDNSISGNWLLFRQNPTLNSGNWEILKVIGNSITVLFQSNTPLTRGINDFFIEYNKTTETAYFYLNNVLIHTATSINIPDTVNLWARWGLNTTQTSIIKTLGLIDYIYGYKKNV